MNDQTKKFKIYERPVHKLAVLRGDLGPEDFDLFIPECLNHIYNPGHLVLNFFGAKSIDISWTLFFKQLQYLLGLANKEFCLVYMNKVDGFGKELKEIFKPKTSFTPILDKIIETEEKGDKVPYNQKILYSTLYALIARTKKFFRKVRYMQKMQTEFLGEYNAYSIIELANYSFILAISLDKDQVNAIMFEEKETYEENIIKVELLKLVESITSHVVEINPHFAGCSFSKVNVVDKMFFNEINIRHGADKVNANDCKQFSIPLEHESGKIFMSVYFPQEVTIAQKFITTL